MGRKVATLQFLFMCLCLSHSSLAPFIHKCTSQDTKCIKESAQAAVPILAAGIPSLGVDTLDPMTISRIDSSASDLKFILTNVTVTGLKECVIKKIKRDSAKSKMHVKTLCTLDINGQYEASGKILVLPVEGHGDIHVRLNKALYTTDSNMETVKKENGKAYWHIKDAKHTFELQDKATMTFSNLFNGNEVLARAAQDVIDGSTNEIVMEIGKPIFDVTLKKVTDTIDQFYSAVPAEDLALD